MLPFRINDLRNIRVAENFFFITVKDECNEIQREIKFHFWFVIVFVFFFFFINILTIRHISKMERVLIFVMLRTLSLSHFEEFYWLTIIIIMLSPILVFLHLLLWKAFQVRKACKFLLSTGIIQNFILLFYYEINNRGNIFFPLIHWTRQVSPPLLLRGEDLFESWFKSCQWMIKKT